MNHPCTVPWRLVRLALVAGIASLTTAREPLFEATLAVGERQETISTRGSAAGCRIGTTGQGVLLENKGVVLFGAASTSSRPATIDIEKVAEMTPEYREIKARDLDVSSARYSLLVKAMLKRIKEACKAVAVDTSSDFVTREGDIQCNRGLPVTNLTDTVIEELERSETSLMRTEEQAKASESVTTRDARAHKE